MVRRRHAKQRTHRERWIGLCIHFAVFVVVNSGLTTLNLIRRPEQLWFYWPLMGWGAGLALHAFIFYRRNRSKKI